jgi:hypothetical protein
MTTPLRWVKAEHAAELVSNYHLARAAGKSKRHERLVWASAGFAKEHPYVSPTAAYKDLCALLE